MSKVQLFAVNTAGDTVLLQLSDESPLKMTLSVQDLNPFTATSYYSQTFFLPGQGVNGQFFEDVYSVNGYSFDASVQAQAWINNDGFLFSIGNMNLKSVVINERDNSIKYEVFFLGDTSDFSSAVGSEYMNTIDTTALNHDLTYANVVLSWDATPGFTSGLLDGNVLYPLCEWGYLYDADNYPVQTTLSVDYPKGSTGLYPRGGSFTNGPTSGLSLKQLKPAVRVKWVWDELFRNAGYSYDSAFLNSDLFDQMYMVCDSVPRTIQTPSALCDITANPATIPIGISTKIFYNNTVSNPGLNFNTTKSQYDAPFAGSYTFRLSGTATSPTPQGVFYVQILKNGTVINPGATNRYQTNPLTVNFTFDITVALTLFDIITVELFISTWSISPITFTKLEFECIDAPQEPVQVSSFFPPEGTVKKIDFIKGITTLFNLVFEPTRNQAKKFKIEPWIDWIREGKQQDWTQFLDGSNDTQQYAPFLDQQRTLQLTGVEDADFQNTVYEQQYKRSYLFREYNSGINLIKGTNTITVPFAATPLESIPARTTQYPQWIIPSLGKFQPGNPNENRSAKIQPIQPKPRILFYNGLKANPVQWYLNDDLPIGATGIAQDFYPLVSPYQQFPPTKFTLDLSFQSKTALWSPAALYDGRTATDLYTGYWEDYTEWLYDPYNRIKTVTMRLNPYQIETIRYNDIVWVKDCWYFVTKISDYPVGDCALVKVELIKVPSKALPQIQQGASGPPQGECMSVAVCNNNSPYEPTQTNTWTYADCFNNIQTLTLSPKSCGSICMLFPNAYALPPGWTAIPNGNCSGITPSPSGEFIYIDLDAPGQAGMDITLLIEGATGGTAGTYIPLQYYNMTAIDQFAGLSYNVPYDYGFKATLTWNNGATGQDFVEGSYIIMEENASQVAAISYTGYYAGPIATQLPTGVTAAAYQINAFITGVTLPPPVPGCPIWNTDTDTWGASTTIWSECPPVVWNTDADQWNLSTTIWNI